MTINSSPIQFRRLLWVGPLAIIASIIGVLIVRIIAIAILQPNPEPMSLGWTAPIILTTFFVGGAVLVFALVARFARNPIRTYQIIAFVVLLFSFLPDAAYAQASVPGAGWPVAIALMIMHVVAWAICVIILSKLSTAQSK